MRHRRLAIRLDGAAGVQLAELIQAVALRVIELAEIDRFSRRATRRLGIAGVRLNRGLVMSERARRVHRDTITISHDDVLGCSLRWKRTGPKDGCSGQSDTHVHADVSSGKNRVAARRV